LIESDFLRDYGINLGEVFYTLTWRRFISLFSGLNKDSSFWSVYIYNKTNAPLDDDPMALARELKASMKGGRKKKAPDRMVTH
jgi:hypothetical protein